LLTPKKELEIGAKLGEGTFGVVYRAKWRGMTVAVKELKAQAVTKEVINDFKKEIGILA
jgi:serine/threonine protein kinase